MNLKNSVKSFLKSLDRMRYRHLCNLSGVEYQPCDYKTGNTPPADGWMPYTSDMPLQGTDAHFWLRASFRTPAVQEGEELILRINEGFDGHGQGLLYLNGRMIQGIDNNHTEAFLEPETEYELYNYIYTGTRRSPSFYSMELLALNKQVEQLYYDVKVPYEVCELLSEADSDWIRMMSVLSDAARLVDLRDPDGETCQASVKDAIDFMASEFYGKLCTTEGKPVVHCVGHTHIDVEWLWHRAQTREKIQRSFATAKMLMDRYPEYKFTLSQPELYRYLKEEAPEKYEELKELVKEGRWEPEGAMYLEADCNLTSGESLVRQILHGKKFFRKEFGKESRVLFLPDVFGYSAAMPQILNKSGVEYFVTSKISWNDTNLMPKDAFLWEGIDGSEIFTSFITTQGYGGEPGAKHKGTTYCGKLNPSEIKGTWERFQQKEYSVRIMTTYGYGDGGGGPTKEMLEVQRRLAKGLPQMPVTEMSLLYPYLQAVKGSFDEACNRTDCTPKWVGELYLEFHRGTYTSVAKVKRGNRKSEFLLANAEALSVTDLTFGGDYDAEGLNRIWRKTLHNQFHDILPGSSIKWVYDGTDKDYAAIAEYADGVATQKLSAIASRLNTEGGTLIYNPTGFARRVALSVNGTYRETVEVVPSYGWTVVQDTAPNSRVTVQGMTAENDFYVLTLNEAGQIETLLDKRVGRGVFKAGRCGNVLTVFEDNPNQYDNWELQEFYRLKPYPLNDKATVIPVTDGTRAGFRIKRQYMHSTILQTLWLYSESSRIDFETVIDWHEHHQVLKASFPLHVHAMSATYDIQYGHVTRATHENTSWDEAKFEVYGHKWADISESGYGVALLNDCKYGYSARGSDLSLTLLKCGTDPNPDADQGEHRFTYSLMPHVGDFREAGVITEAWALNQPLLYQSVGAGKGSLAEIFSLVSVDVPNAVITAVKKAEDDNGLVVRFHDAYDCKSTVTVSVPAEYGRAWLCNLLEEPERELTVTDGRVTLSLSNFEIVTLKFAK